jgi:hypothetical protein
LSDVHERILLKLRKRNVIIKILPEQGYDTAEEAHAALQEEFAWITVVIGADFDQEYLSISKQIEHNDHDTPLSLRIQVSRQSTVLISAYSSYYYSILLNDLSQAAHLESENE